MAYVALLACLVLAWRVMSLERTLAQHRAAVTRAVTSISNATHRVDDRLTYYERRRDGLMGLRLAYDKALEKRKAKLADPSQSVAPEGAAQAERLVG